MKKTWKLRLFQDQDMDELVNLCQLQVGKAAAVTAEYITWQREHNPAGQAQLGIAKERSTDKILGLVWFMPFNIQIERQSILGSQSLYALVHPDFRGQGIFTGLVPFCLDNLSQAGIHFSYGLPNPKSFTPFVKRLGWTHIGEARLWVRPLNIHRIFTRRYGQGLIYKCLGTIGQPAGKLLPHPKPIETNQITIEKMHPNDQLLEDFWQRICGKYPIMLRRDSTFLNWRYGLISGRNYTLLAAIHQGEIEAYIVLRDVIIQGLSCGNIVDFLVMSTKIGQLAGEVLVYEAIRIFEGQDLDLVGCMMLPSAEEVKILRRQGLILCPTWLQPQPIPIILKADKDYPYWNQLSDINNWFLTMGDHDAV